MEFKDLVKARRMEIGKTLEEIGNEIGVSKATVQRWESGEIKDIRRSKLVDLAKALQVEPAYLMGWEESYKPVAVSPSDSPPQLTTDEAELIAAFRVADPADQDAVRALLSKYRRKNTKNAVG